MRRYFAGKSKDTWFQLPKEERMQFKNLLIVKYGAICSRKYRHGCGRRFGEEELSVDHIIPISMGGEVCNIDNMQLLCFRCHERKTRRERTVPYGAA